MQHQALYRKWRPSRFEDVVGQDHITRTLRAQSASGALSHAYLFCGPRGTGKTTCARILAKAANCTNLRDGDPCNECDACRSINEGTAADVVEIDAAAVTSVDNIRELREEALFAPSALKKRVYVLDEVHMLSMSAFNALLKILEEPPEHVMFILASTELQKIPPTVLSRCQRYEFKRIERRDIARQLMTVAASEGIPLAESGAALIAQMADGAMRNGLSLLEQAAASAAGRSLDSQSAAQALGLLSSAKLIEIARRIAASDTAGALELFSEEYESGVEPAGFLDQLMCLYRDALLLTSSREISLLGNGYAPSDIDALLGLYEPSQLLYSARCTKDILAGLSQSPNKRIDAEMCIIALSNPAVSTDIDALSARVAKLERALRSGVVPSPAASPAPEPEPAMPAPSAAKPEPKPAPAAPDKPVPLRCRDDLLAAAAEDDSVSTIARTFLRQSQFYEQGARVIIVPNAAGFSLLSKKPLLDALSQIASDLRGCKTTVVAAESLASDAAAASAPDGLDELEALQSELS